MVAYTKLSPNHSGQRTHSIDRITPHCVVGQCTAEGLGEWFEKTSTKASSNYGIDKDGRVGMYGGLPQVSVRGGLHRRPQRVSPRSEERQ